MTSMLSTHRFITLRRAGIGLALVGTLALLSACASPSVEDYAQERPALDLREYFNGPLTAQGMFTDRQGKVVKRFTVQMTGKWTGNEGVLEEHFVYSDGTTQERTWHIQYLGEGRYSGQAGDVVGPATGQAAGNALHWNYVLALPVNGRVWNVRMDDWMYLMDGRTMLNRTAMSKFGIHLGDLTISFSKGSQ